MRYSGESRASFSNPDWAGERVRAYQDTMQVIEHGRELGLTAHGWVHIGGGHRATVLAGYVQPNTLDDAGNIHSDEELVLIRMRKKDDEGYVIRVLSGDTLVHYISDAIEPEPDISHLSERTAMEDARVIDRLERTVFDPALSLVRLLKLCGTSYNTQAVGQVIIEGLEIGVSPN